MPFLALISFKKDGVTLLYNKGRTILKPAFDLKLGLRPLINNGERFPHKQVHHSGIALVSGQR